MKKTLIATGLFFTALSAPVLADVMATYQFSGERIEIMVADDERMRMNMSKGQFLIKQGEEVYSVSGNDKQGYIAISLKDIASIAFRPQQEMPTPSQKDISVVNTGKVEEVAGFPGNIFVMSYQQDGKKVRSELVLSKDKRLATVRRALLGMTSTWAKMAGSDVSIANNFAQIEPQLQKFEGILRQDKTMKLLALTEKKIPSDYYELPPNTQIQDLSMVSGMLKGGEMMNCDAESAQYNPLCLMQEAGEEAVDESKQEARQQAKDKMKQKVKGFLKDIF